MPGRSRWRVRQPHDGYSTEELWFDEWEHHGTQWENAEAYEKFNPVNHVADWKVPMLVVHSARRISAFRSSRASPRSPRCSGAAFPSEFLTFPDENHWVLKPQNSVLWHDTVNAWLKKWTKAAS